MFPKLWIKLSPIKLYEPDLEPSNLRQGAVQQNAAYGLAPSRLTHNLWIKLNQSLSREPRNILCVKCTPSGRRSKQRCVELYIL